MRPLIFITLLIMSVSCSSPQTATDTNSGAGMTPAEPGAIYIRQIEKYSDGEANYTGFYNTFEYKATLHNTAIRTAMLQKQNDYYQWDREKFLSEREKSEKEIASETTVFLSFYTPERRNDNLYEAKSIWRIYLDAGGRRYQGKVKRVRSLLAELQALYPYHTRWNSPYTVTFPVPTAAVETQNLTLTVTGPLGSKTVKFPATN